MPQDERRTLGEHLDELRYRIFLCLGGVLLVLIICIVFVNPVTEFWTRPIRKALEGKELLALDASEIIVTDLEICLMTAVLLAVPFIVYQMWCFVSAGLKPNERRLGRIFIPLSLLLFAAGALTWYGFLQGIAVKFLTNSRGRSWLVPMPSYGNFAAFSIKMVLMMGLAFQLPLIMMIVEKLHIVRPEQFARYRRHAVLAIFVVAMILTPPDVISQCGMAIPMVVLYELGIWLGRISIIAGGHKGETAS